MKRCPFCQKLPVLHTNAVGYWNGGCETELTMLCASLSGILYQPTYEMAVSQWNYLVDNAAPMAELFHSQARVA